MNRKEIQIVLDGIEYTCSGFFMPARGGGYNRQFGNYLPPDPADIHNFRVFLEDEKGQLTEVTNAMAGGADYQALADKFIEICETESQGVSP